VSVDDEARPRGGRRRCARWARGTRPRRRKLRCRHAAADAPATGRRAAVARPRHHQRRPWHGGIRRPPAASQAPALRRRMLGSRKHSLPVPVMRTSGPTPSRPRTRLGLFLHALRHIEYLRVAGLNARRTRPSTAPRSTCSARSAPATVGPLFRPVCRAPFDHFCESRCESDTGG